MDPVTRSIDQLVGAWRIMCGRGPLHALASGDGVEYAFSGLPVPFFNLAAVTASDLSAATLAATARAACGWAADKGVPWMFVVTHERLAPGVDATATLDACGLAPLLGMTAMEARSTLAPQPAPGDLALGVPGDDAACGELVDINAVAYGMDLAPTKALLADRAFWADHFPIVGHADGKPVSTASVLMVDGVQYVALVATDPGQQRRGYADAAMRRALELATETHGERLALLHATDAGRPVYARMGFAPTSTLTVFMEKTFLGGH